MVFGHCFAPYLLHRNRNNENDHLRNKLWREKIVQKTKFEAAEMILDPWNQQCYTVTKVCHLGLNVLYNHEDWTGEVL